MARILGQFARLGALMVIVGCRSAPEHSWYKDGWRGGFSYADARQYLNGYAHVLVVCITEDHVEDLDPTRPDSWSVLCFEGTVVKSYKGDWAVGEKVAFAHALDGTVKKQSNTRVGDLMFLFTNAHTNTEIGVETGDFERYLPETDRLLRSLFPEDATGVGSEYRCRR